MILTDEKIEEILFRENLSIAIFSHRFGAFLIDWVLVCLFSWGFCLTLFAHNLQGIEDKISFIQKFLFFVFVFMFSYELFFTTIFGATLGKIIFRLKVVSIQSLDKPDFKANSIRCIIKIIEEMTGCLLLIFVFSDKFLRSIHDKASKSIVISAG